IGSGNDRVCFALANRQSVIPCAIRLDDESAWALAALVPLLGCGEEAAALGFARLGTAHRFDPDARTILDRIAFEERHHDALMRGLKAALPFRPVKSGVLDRIRHFHFGLAQGGPVQHLACIAGLDAAVCTIISRLIRPRAILSGDRAILTLLRQIRDDEARHVAASRALVLAAPDAGDFRDRAAQIRVGLAALLVDGHDAFERLGVDPVRLDRDLCCLPDGLLPR
ncbi:MAG: hypothetical protein RL367_2579, partial [Pseudomonadota bacterium]